MRMKAAEDGIPIPEFTPLFNWKEIHEYIDRVPAPWILKARQEAASMGLQKVRDRDDLWPRLDKLGDKMSLTLMEKFLPGDLYHVDSVIHDSGQVVFAAVNKYGTPMLKLTQEGGVFTTRTIERGSADEVALQDLNKRVIKSMGLKRGVTHIEYIKADEDGKFYFLEAAARVGAARIPDVVWYATDVCLWHEWARIEINQGPSPLGKMRDEYAGVALSISRDKEPDLSSFNDPEICFRQARDYKAGLIVKSKDPNRVDELIQKYAERFQNEFMIHTPMPEGR